MPEPEFISMAQQRRYDYLKGIKWRCNLGAPTNRPQIMHSMDECLCEAACEPHIHEDEDTILCMHDGETNHEHCPVLVHPLRNH